ncbi:MAG TPA: flavin reductase family protein [Acidimicrobiales bacterium]|nr:flavin reductase family protein [Acidimicrobiales bacterium]
MLRQVAGCFATGVTVVTTSHGDDWYGMTANAVLSVSLDPPMALVSIDRRALTGRMIEAAGHFCVSYLARDQWGLAERFARPGSNGRELFRRAVAGRSGDGDPRIGGALGQIACRTGTIYPGGDHDLFLGAVVELWSAATAPEPLVFFRGGFRSLEPAERRPSAVPGDWPWLEHDLDWPDDLAGEAHSGFAGW